MAKKGNAQKTLEEVAQDILEALKDKKGAEARLEIVEQLLAMAYKRTTIIRIIRSTFKISVHQVDRDIQKAKDHFINWYRKKNQEERIGNSLAQTDLILNKAHRRGELKVALRAVRLQAELLGILKFPEIPLPSGTNITFYLPKNERD